MGFYLNKFKHLTNKQEMNTAATVLFVFTIICAWSAFGLGVSSVGAKTWIYKTSTFEGLWQSCVSTDNCSKTGPVLKISYGLIYLGALCWSVAMIVYTASY